MQTIGRFLTAGRAAARRIGPVLAMAAGLSLAAVAAPANAYQLGDFLKNAASSLPKMPSQKPATPAPNSQTATAGGAPGQPMGLQSSATALPPLHKLGTDAVAVIEAASPGAPVRQMDYVFAKQTIALGPKGTATLSFLSGCLTEVVQGGTVTVGTKGSTVAGGRMQSRPTPGCRSANPIILASASEAGATVNRITPFTGVDWDERALKGGPPVFKWDAALGAATVRVKAMNETGAPVLWQASVAKEWIAYPPSAPPLATGMPYKAEVLSGDKVVASALFYIDPALDEDPSLANRVVPLAAP
ncbi:hypothetical protein [Phenylobacterium sp.]|uniref:hypothetical protein n=1 Tax=Phenylobacterium sp. TaxID=1871053 RepID=UPI00122A7E69|nr:hypothetical protein [Phenylobacterium sp.]THD60659.1 MAG: hypothetical protein E8A12_10605 [Phenylobacterium sp.]